MNQKSSAGNNVIVIGASAGGVEALRSLAAGLPADLPAAVFVVLHVWPEGKSLLPRILAASGPLPAQHAVDGEEFSCGRIYIAPPDFHLTLHDHHTRLTRGPRENRHRPAVDPLFRSAALTCGPRVTGVILTGTLDDGAAGLRAVKDRGGIAIVQDPLEAAYSGMPQSALAAAKVDYVLKLAEIPGTLAELARHGRPARHNPDAPVSEMLEENAASEAVMSALNDDVNHPGDPSVYSCPDCHGTLWEIGNGQTLHFRCRVGHAYTAATLAIEQNESVERALWAALRALEESASMHRRMALRAQQHDQYRTAGLHEEQVTERESSAETIRQMLLGMRTPEEQTTEP